MTENVKKMMEKFIPIRRKRRVFLRHCQLRLRAWRSRDDCDSDSDVGESVSFMKLVKATVSWCCWKRQFRDVSNSGNFVMLVKATVLRRWRQRQFHDVGDSGFVTSVTVTVTWRWWQRQSRDFNDSDGHVTLTEILIIKNYDRNKIKPIQFHVLSSKYK